MLQHRKIKNLGARAYRMISPDSSFTQLNNHPLPEETVRGIWQYVLEKIARQGGPFAGSYKTDKFFYVLHILPMCHYKKFLLLFLTKYAKCGLKIFGAVNWPEY